MKNLKIGEKGKAMINSGTAVLSAGLSKSDSKTEMPRTFGYKVGTKNIPALFWNPMLSTNGQKETEERDGND